MLQELQDMLPICTNRLTAVQQQQSYTKYAHLCQSPGPRRQLFNVGAEERYGFAAAIAAS